MVVDLDQGLPKFLNGMTAKVRMLMTEKDITFLSPRPYRILIAKLLADDGKRNINMQAALAILCKPHVAFWTKRMDAPASH